MPATGPDGPFQCPGNVGSSKLTNVEMQWWGREAGPSGDQDVIPAEGGGGISEIARQLVVSSTEKQKKGGLDIHTGLFIFAS